MQNWMTDDKYLPFLFQLRLPRSWKPKPCIKIHMEFSSVLAAFYLEPCKRPKVELYLFSATKMETKIVLEQVVRWLLNIFNLKNHNFPFLNILQVTSIYLYNFGSLLGMMIICAFLRGTNACTNAQKGEAFGSYIW